MYRFRNFWFRLKRGLSWFIFSFKQNPWQEEYELFEVIEKGLLDTANNFEMRDKKGWLIAIRNKEDIRDMRLAAKLLRMGYDEYYFNKIELPCHIEQLLEAEKKDERAIQIALNIIAQRGRWWWI